MKDPLRALICHWKGSNREGSEAQPKPPEGTEVPNRSSKPTPKNGSEARKYVFSCRRAGKLSATTTKQSHNMLIKIKCEVQTGFDWA
jgi:hypothetical protein